MEHECCDGDGLRNFLRIPYEDLEKSNLEAKQAVINRTDPSKLRDKYLGYLKEESRIKAVTVCFSDIEGRFHMLDYDKKYFLKSYENLTFDGSSIRGFTQVNESDLRLDPDWSSFRQLPSDVFRPGKVLIFSNILDRDGTPYASDMRAQLRAYTDRLYKDKGYTVNVAVECEGFLFEGLNSEQNYSSHTGFQTVSSGGYFNSLPNDPLRLFIDAVAEAQRALGFENEKDHPEVAPSQFELNYKYCDAVVAADQVHVYKLVARQVAANAGCTACFLPKPVSGINGSGMHTNISVAKGGKNIFYDAKGEDGLSELAWSFIDRILFSANDICVGLNSSVNAYRRLDPHFEAPNQIKSSAIDRTSMVRIPLANEQSARIEVRSVAPDANPYLVFLLLLATGLEGPMEAASVSENRRSRTRFLPDNIYDAVRHFKGSELVAKILGEDSRDKYAERKLASAHRCPRELGAIVKTEEVLFHHEVTNQYLWSKF